MYPWLVNRAGRLSGVAPPFYRPGRVRVEHILIVSVDDKFDPYGLTHIW
jgi:hypothetical protein